MHLDPYKDVTVFCAKTLEFLSEGVYPAAIHKVKKDLFHRPRLSLVYELRPKAGFDFSSFETLYRSYVTTKDGKPFSFVIK